VEARATRASGGCPASAATDPLSRRSNARVLLTPPGAVRETLRTVFVSFYQLASRVVNGRRKLVRTCVRTGRYYPVGLVLRPFNFTPGPDKINTFPHPRPPGP